MWTVFFRTCRKFFDDGDRYSFFHASRQYLMTIAPMSNSTDFIYGLYEVVSLNGDSSVSSCTGTVNDYSNACLPNDETSLNIVELPHLMSSVVSYISMYVRNTLLYIAFFDLYSSIIIHNYENIHH